MLTVKQVITVSRIIDKLDLKITDPKADVNTIGSDLIMQIASKAHQAEADVAVLVSTFAKCTPEEALEMDIVDLYEKHFKDQKLLSFFTSAVKQKLHE